MSVSPTSPGSFGAGPVFDSELQAPAPSAQRRGGAAPVPPPSIGAASSQEIPRWACCPRQICSRGRRQPHPRGARRSGRRTAR